MITESPSMPDLAANSEGLKVHLRLVGAANLTYRVVSLRPATGVRFSTNRFHDTWHILTDGGGAFILARLLWGLAFQKQPNTVVMIDRPHLVPTPFDADPADQILFAMPGTPTDTDHLRALVAALRRSTSSDRTIRFHTFGLPRAVAWTREEWRRRRHDLDALRSQERIDRRAGVLCYSAPPEILRAEATMIYGTKPMRSGNYHYLVERDRYPEGEVQVFSNFADRLSAARVARREIVGDLDQRIPEDDQRWAVQRRTESGHARLIRARRGASKETG
jgi:hypothetical protein